MQERESIGTTVAKGLAIATMGGFVVGISIASGGYALIPLGALWAGEAICPINGERFILTKTAFVLITEAYKAIGRGIKSIGRSASKACQPEPMIINNSFDSFDTDDLDDIKTLENDELLTKANQSLSDIANIEKALDAEEERQNKNLPPIIPIRSINEISGVQENFQTLQHNPDETNSEDSPMDIDDQIYKPT